MSSSPGRFTSLSLLLSLGACVAPADTFAEFGERVVDASAVLNTCPSSAARTSGTPRAIPDVGEEYLLALEVSFAPGLPLQFRCTTDLSPAGDNGSLDLSCLPLTVDGRVVVGEALGQDNILVDPAGAFCATIVGTVPGDANPISGSNIVTNAGGLQLSGTIQSEALMCGTVAGGITMPFVGDITGSFGAVPATPGATGADLPEPVLACPEV